jgi:hypothetical protein
MTSCPLATLSASGLLSALPVGPTAIAAPFVETACCARRTGDAGHEQSSRLDEPGTDEVVLLVEVDIVVVSLMVAGIVSLRFCWKKLKLKVKVIESG